MQPKYINGLLTSAATRKLDHLRAEEKMLQREREAEGDMYADKEEFVTEAYKKQMAEVRAAEEEEKKREGECLVLIHIPKLSSYSYSEAEKKKRGGAPTGLAFFYQQMLNQDDSAHQAAVAATMKPEQGPSEESRPNLTIVKPPEITAKSDLQLATEAQAEGKDVELNDDNQIVDKRELLSAGLNLSAPNTRHLGRSSGKKKAPTDEVQAHRAVGTAASKREINDRRAREIEKQMQEETERVAQEREREERERTERIVAKRNQDSDILSARERYLARKRRKLEEDTELDKSAAASDAAG
jgi:coiled-coil domain-containing protein 55